MKTQKTQISFEKLLTTSHFKKALKEMDIHDPTQVQERAIPLICEGKDVICHANTGSGKTIAFALPIAEQLKETDGLQALVLVPTRELCEQVTEELRKITKYHPLQILDVYGGVSIENQIRKIKDTHVIVATPGRLLDLLNRRAVRLDSIKTLVLDEADRMLDMGFIKDVETIMKATPNKKQTIMLSATTSSRLQHLVQRYMKNPKTIKTKEQVDKNLLRQYFYLVPIHERFHLLAHLLKKEKSHYAIVFCGTRRTVDLIAYNLKKNGITAHALHGGHSQAMRKRAMTSFHGKETQILVASDVAARGIDVKLLTHVYNFDVPKTAQEYVHRIGRTARAGEEGTAVTLVSEKDYDNFRRIQQDRTLKIEKIEAPKVPILKFLRRIPKKSSQSSLPRYPKKRSFNRSQGQRRNSSAGRNRSRRNPSEGRKRT